MSRFEEFAEKSRQVACAVDLQILYSAAIEAEGYENLLFTSVRGREIEQLHWLELPDGYPDQESRKSWRIIDPVLGYAMRVRRPFLWNDAVEPTDRTKIRIVFINDYEQAGLHSCITFPFHGPGNQLDILNISRRSFEPTSQERLDYLHWITRQTWTRFLELTEDDPFSSSQDAGLTEREIEVLRWSKDGKSYAEIAEILSISRKTVEFHMRNAMAKVGAHNKISAVVMAIHRGLIDL